MFDTPNITGLSEKLIDENIKTVRFTGTISKIVGLTLESSGPVASIGDLVEIQSLQNHNKVSVAEVSGFRDNQVLLSPLEGIEGIKKGDKVYLINENFNINVSDDILGRVIDAMGRPLDSQPPIKGEKWKLHRPAPNSMERKRITEPFITGIRSIDSCITCGVGQRIGIFSGSGVGKSSILGMIARNSLSDINVIALIGERGKEVREFIEDSLGAEGLKKSVMIVSTSDKTPLQRVKGAETAMAIAEYFRNKGKNVLFMMDSVTRYAMAQREIGLAVGEPPATKGYPPSVFNMLPSLLERAGNNDKGSITAFFTVLVEGDDMNDPIGDTVRGILDGHITLSRELATKGHFPSIDVLESISRVMNNVTKPENLTMAQNLRELLSIYKNSEDMINIGAYQKGSNPLIDKSIEKNIPINDFLKQGLYENNQYIDTISQLNTILNTNTTKATTNEEV